MVNIILSGGVGSRLWPLSRRSQPKQYIPLFQGKTLFQFCAQRNQATCRQVTVVGNVDNYLLSRNNLESAGIYQYSEIIEATPRNTAAAIAFAACSLHAHDIMLVTPSDHIIDDTDAYDAAVGRAAALAEQGFLVTFGIRPAYAETGYGYIEYKGEDVIAFREKPSFADAKQFIASGRFLWNSGIFCFKAGTFLEELQRFEPHIYETAKTAWEQRNGSMLDEQLSLAIPSKSVDYAVMERSEKIKVIPANFGWNDLGSFDALWSYMEQDGFIGNTPNLALGSQKHVEFIGVEDILYVETQDAVLILNRNNSQDVKQVYDRLQQEKPQLLL